MNRFSSNFVTQSMALHTENVTSIKHLNPKVAANISMRKKMSVIFGRVPVGGSELQEQDSVKMA
jgi:hypothetical protein